MRSLPLMVILFAASLVYSKEPAEFWETLQPPEKDGIWIRPASGKPAQPIWGHVDGLRVGLAPLPGPRGLLRIYTPYMGQPDIVLINFIAVEPIIEGETVRGFSELEQSALDSTQGKRFWSADSPDAPSPKPPQFPARGVVQSEGTTQTLTVYILLEPFDNGAKVYVRLRFRSDRPHEVGLSTWTQKGSRPLKHCVLTATMGNYARLRRLYLRNSTKTSLQLWPDFKGDGFAPHAVFPLNELILNKQDDALFIAAPNEGNPEQAEYSPDTAFWWKYKGRPSTQYWRRENPPPGLAGLVNGRACYWASASPIPGGIAFENFELIEPFHPGAELCFGVTPFPPEEFIKSENIRRLNHKR